MPDPADRPLAPVCFPDCWWEVLCRNKTQGEFYSFRRPPRWHCPRCRQLRAAKLAHHLAEITAPSPYLWVARFEEPVERSNRRLDAIHTKARRVGAGRLVIRRGEKGWDRDKAYLVVTDYPNLSPRSDIFTRYPAVAARALARHFCWQRNIERAQFFAPWPTVDLASARREEENPDEYEVIGTFSREDIDDIIACYPSPTDEDVAEILAEKVNRARMPARNSLSSWETFS